MQEIRFNLILSRPARIATPERSLDGPAGRCRKRCVFLDRFNVAELHRGLGATCSCPRLKRERVSIVQRGGRSQRVATNFESSLSVNDGPRQTGRHVLENLPTVSSLSDSRPADVRTAAVNLKSSRDSRYFMFWSWTRELQASGGSSMCFNEYGISLRLTSMQGFEQNCEASVAREWRKLIQEQECHYIDELSSEAEDWN